MVSPPEGLNTANPAILVILILTIGGLMPNTYGDLTTLKSPAFLNTPDDGHDERLLGMLETASRWVDGYCDRHFFVSAGKRRFDGTGRVILAVTDLVSAAEVRVRQGSTGRWVGWNSGDWLAYPLNAAPTEPDGRPYTRIVAAAGGRLYISVRTGCEGLLGDRPTPELCQGWTAVSVDGPDIDVGHEPSHVLPSDQPPRLHHRLREGSWLFSCSANPSWP